VVNEPSTEQIARVTELVEHKQTDDTAASVAKEATKAADTDVKLVAKTDRARKRNEDRMAEREAKKQAKAAGKDKMARLSSAVDARLENLSRSYGSLAEFYEVSSTTLKAHCEARSKGATAAPGRKTVLCAEEDALVVWVVFLARIRFPATRRMIWLKAKEIAELVRLFFVLISDHANLRTHDFRTWAAF